jgi:hypothetical protein
MTWNLSPGQLGLLAAASGMMQGGDFRTGLGNAFGAGISGYLRGQQNEREAELMRMKTEEYKRQQEQRERQTRFFQQLPQQNPEGALQQGLPREGGPPLPPTQRETYAQSLGIPEHVSNMLQTAYQMQGPDAAGDLYGAYTLQQMKNQIQPEVFGDKDNGYWIYDFETGEARRIGPTAAELAASAGPGGLDLKDRLAAQRGMRTEIASDPRAKNYRTAYPLYEAAIRAAKRNDRAADVDLVYAIAKIYDPTSVVRESEYGMVVESDVVPQWLRDYASKMNTAAGRDEQGRIPGRVRQQLLRSAEDRMRSYYNPYRTLIDDYTNFASRGQLDVESVIPSDMPWIDMPMLDEGPYGPRVPAPGAPAYPGAGALDQMLGGMGSGS